MAHAAERIDKEAARWAVRLADDPLPLEEQRELDAWLAADVRHQGALIRARAVWTGLDRFAALSGGSAHATPDAAPGRFAYRRSIAAALGALMIATAASIWLSIWSGTHTYVSEVGEVRRVALEDGSRMLLNTDSKVRVRFGEARRDVRLIRGEALFEVAKDATRPFVVDAGDLAVKAVGTAFAVRRDSARVAVTVTEGTVELVPTDDRDVATPTRVTASHRAIATEAQPVEVQPIMEAETERRLAWRNGMVAFDGEPLSDAVAEVNRYSRRQIVVDDNALALRPIVGVFRASDAEGFARTAAAALNAQVIEQGDTLRLVPGAVP